MSQSKWLLQQTLNKKSKLIFFKKHFGCRGIEVARGIDGLKNRSGKCEGLAEWGSTVV
jgi:hypothetical protein